MYSYDGFIFISLLLFYFIADTYCFKTCGIQTKPLEAARIVNGHDLEYARKYPWYTALVSSNNPNQLVCGGALINERHVLTAAHCFKPYFKDVEKGKVRLEDIYLAKLGINNICISEREVQIFASIKVHIHGKYYEDLLFYDIAIMVLEESVISFMPICLPLARYESNNRTGLMGTIIGLGKEASSAFKTPCTVKEATIPLQADSICSNMIKLSKKQKYVGVFCAGYPEGGTDTCQGDSGGPVQVYNKTTNTWMVLGITSFGYGCALANYYGVYTDVSHYLHWIHDKMEYDENVNYEYDTTEIVSSANSKHKPRFHMKTRKHTSINKFLLKLLENF